MEAKLDAILIAVDKAGGEQAVKDIDATYLGRETDEGYKRRLAAAEEKGRSSSDRA
ncbi:hypothetical protein [Pseudorhodoplanes sinuspersici]|uniref:hypothetical protein n=1 Tax=Pseudorhodoplanes sinuspersici TaxID=1235591 RepID=UPI00160431FD|nr:hypothetical protein [Pseudorhodoplanes sinuspersici]